MGHSASPKTILGERAKLHMPDKLMGTKNLMAALGRMPPKPHDQMKVGEKAKVKKTRGLAKKPVSSKPKTA